METPKYQNIISINFCGFWGSFNKQDNLFTKILSKYFKVEISETPDFVICSNRGKPFEYMKYDCVRIMFMGENMSPDFTAFDYCIGFDFMDFGDRYFRLPFGFYFDNAEPWIPEKLSAEQASEILRQKKYFCNFIYGHPSSHGMRELLFQKLSEYKTVVSPGSYLNNVSIGGKPSRCSWQEKREYLDQSKFTIAGDSIHYPGFVTEKIVQPFQHHSIPVYFGSTRIGEDFNEKAFVCCREPDDIDRVLEQVQYLDTHDDAYIEMLSQCPLRTENQLVELYAELENFLVRIFEQNPEKALRRVRYFAAEQHESYLKEYADQYSRTPEIVRKLKSKLRL